MSIGEAYAFAQHRIECLKLAEAAECKSGSAASETGAVVARARAYAGFVEEIATSSHAPSQPDPAP